MHAFPGCVCTRKYQWGVEIYRDYVSQMPENIDMKYNCMLKMHANKALLLLLLLDREVFSWSCECV